MLRREYDFLFSGGIYKIYIIDELIENIFFDKLNLIVDLKMGTCPFVYLIFRVLFFELKIRNVERKKMLSPINKYKYNIVLKEVIV